MYPTRKKGGLDKSSSVKVRIVKIVLAEKIHPGGLDHPNGWLYMHKKTGRKGGKQGGKTTLTKKVRFWDAETRGLSRERGQSKTAVGQTDTGTGKKSAY